MGEIRPLFRCLLIEAIFSRYPAALDWARNRLQARWGPPALISPEFEFRETDYYAPTMGTELRKQLLAFAPPTWDPANLPDAKLESNAWEQAYRNLGNHPEIRPLNIDPGYLTEAKLVLATTKDRDHRIYLKDGIYAEVTLRWLRGQWVADRWTYPDYQRSDFQAFFTDCRQLLRGG